MTGFIFNVFAERKPADAGIHVLWRGGGGHAGKRCAVVFQLQRGHDLGQVRVPLRARHSGIVSGAFHGFEIHSEVQGADAGGSRSAGLHRVRYEKRQRVPKNRKRRQNLLHHGHMELRERD